MIGDILCYYFLLFLIEIFFGSRSTDSDEQLQTDLDKRIFVAYVTTFRRIQRESIETYAKKGLRKDV